MKLLGCHTKLCRGSWRCKFRTKSGVEMLFSLSHPKFGFSNISFMKDIVSLILVQFLEDQPLEQLLERVLLNLCPFKERTEQKRVSER